MHGEAGDRAVGGENGRLFSSGGALVFFIYGLLVLFSERSGNK